MTANGWLQILFFSAVLFLVTVKECLEDPGRMLLGI